MTFIFSKQVLLIIFDENFLDYFHSIARKSTNLSNTTRQMRDNFFPFLGEQQANFHVAFTPHKTFVFTQGCLIVLFTWVVSIIVRAAYHLPSLFQVSSLKVTRAGINRSLKGALIFKLKVSDIQF